jgi:hypothetical protein
MANGEPDSFFGIHHHHYYGSLDADVVRRLARIETLLGAVLAQDKKMADTFDAELQTLTANVANLTTVDGSAVALINGFAAQLAAAVAAAQAAGATPAQLQSFSDLNTAVSTQSASLAAAVTANTSAAPTT